MDKDGNSQRMHNDNGHITPTHNYSINRSSLLSGKLPETTKVKMELMANEVSTIDINHNPDKGQAAQENEETDASSEREADQDEDSVSEEGEEEEEEEEEEDEEDIGADDEASEAEPRKPQIQRENIEMSPEDVADMIEGIEEDIIEFIGTYGKFDQVIEQYKAKVKGLSSRELEDPVRSKEAKKRKWLKIFKYQNIRNERKERLREIVNARNNTTCSPAN